MNPPTMEPCATRSSEPGVAAPSRAGLLWEDDPPPTPEEVAALRRAQREFWAKVPPPIFDVRVVSYPDLKLDWD